jgi:Zn finger protein HypA/HybF involved in hydrogenase expression
MAGDEPKQELCLQCRKVLFEKALSDNGEDPTAQGRTQPNLESDGSDCFYTCPHCGAKNVVVDERNIYGMPTVRISHIKQ